MRKETLGTWLIFVGVLAWVPYAILKWMMGLHPPVLPFLAVHLSGVIPGFILKRYTLLAGIMRKLKTQ
ncbi:MAG: hypothetical protein HYX82_04330 [Chloroflexi bacterium]|nr:hypothetical protein [Chloroflexota bacterium]